MTIFLNMLLELFQVAMVIVLWEYFGKPFATWDGFGTPFRLKNRKGGHG